MERQQVVEFILKEATRLIEEEHIDDLCKHKRYEELANVEVQTTMAIQSYIYINCLDLTCEEIPEGMYLPVAFWCNSMQLDGLIKSEEQYKYAENLEKEAGEFGEAIARKVYSDNCEIGVIPVDKFFDIN